MSTASTNTNTNATCTTATTIEAPVRFYGMQACPTCSQLKSTLDRKGIAWECLDLSDLHTLRDFLVQRDSSDLYSEIKAQKRIGIPSIIRADGTCTPNWQEELGLSDDEIVDEQTAVAEQNTKANTTNTASTNTATTGPACSIDGDHTGC